MSFFGTTAHFIVRDKPGGQLILRSGLLAFRHLQGSHTGKHLADVLYEIIKTAGIEQKVYQFCPTPMPAERTLHALDWLDYCR